MDRMTSGPNGRTNGGALKRTRAAGLVACPLLGWHEWGYQSDDGWQDRQWHGWQWDYQQDQSQDQLLRPQHCFTRPWWSGDHLRPQYFRLAVFFYF